MRCLACNAVITTKGVEYVEPLESSDPTEKNHIKASYFCDRECFEHYLRGRCTPYQDNFVVYTLQ